MTVKAPELKASLRGFGFFKVPSTEYALETARRGQGYILDREPTNPRDPNAILVIHPDTNQPFCYIDRDSAAQVAPFIDKGWVYTCQCVQEPFLIRRHKKVKNDSFIVLLKPLPPLLQKVTRKEKADA